MSSHEATKSLKKTAAKKALAPKAGADGDPTPAQKAAFAKAMYEGVKPGIKTARKIAQEKSDKAKSDAEKPVQKVEILRKIAAPATPVETPDTKRALQLAADIEKATQDGDFERFQPEAQQALIGALCRLYSANNDMGNHFGAVGQRSAVTATDVMVLCGALLKAVDLQVFELGLWQSWSSR
ncbi:hypothetical protein PY365_31735 [Roseiarcaceae bacterium H3SJ34-1]|uniref:hypothetical protein n=1 Tax=Terripilifer ovatus TaxID=3032367 RepID=UPI003AB97374|nr:hypothetical protein [Roseiarcaceae bacterium H3SJ34-1]